MTVIYLGLMGLSVHQLLPSQAVNPRYQKAMYVLSFNLILNSLWVFVFELSNDLWVVIILIVGIGLGYLFTLRFRLKNSKNLNQDLVNLREKL